MTTKTAPKFKIKTKAGKTIGFKNAEVHLGKVSVGAGKVSVSVDTKLPHDVARIVLCQAQLSMTLDVVEGSLFNESVSAVATTGRLSIAFADEQKVTMSMQRDAVDVAQISQFANADALLTVVRQAPAVEEEPEDDDMFGEGGE